MATYATPGVYIEEITGPGVITGVGTSTAAFIGPAAAGPLFTPTVITTFDDYKRIFGLEQWPYLVHRGRRFYLGHAVQGFFENGGTRAVIVRVGSAKAASWSVRNGAGQEVFRIEAMAEGVSGNSYTLTVAESVQVSPAPALVYTTATIKSTFTSVERKQITIGYAADAAPFIAGDTVELVEGTSANRNVIAAVSSSADGPVLTLEKAPAGAPTEVRMAAVDADQRRIRVRTVSPRLQAGGVIQVPGTEAAANAFFSIVERTDAAGFVYLRAPFQRDDGGRLTSSISISGSPAPVIKTVDFDIKVINAEGRVLDEQPGLSLDPFHGGYVFQRAFQSIRVRAPSVPPAARVLSQLGVAGTPAFQPGVDDNPSSVSLDDYRDRALKALDDVDDVSIVCVPDAAIDVSAAIQKAVINHCMDARRRDRIAVLDVPPGRPPANADSALTHRELVTARGGFAALYYPWLLVPEPVEPGRPRPLTPQSIAVPPSGHIAGVFARVDQTLGVHNAPANTEVRGVMGLERVLSDREQGLINLEGVNALRIFPGDDRVVVWGARTTGLKEESDWIYVNVRRLMLYIEESIEEGIRWAVFKPNDRPLWQSLKRTISDFLERVWKDGGLAGRTREQAYQVRIDEGLNRPADIAQGKLYIEIRVAPVRPAEFIIVRIGLWDGGAEVVEN